MTKWCLWARRRAQACLTAYIQRMSAGVSIVVRMRHFELGKPRRISYKEQTRIYVHAAINARL